MTKEIKPAHHAAEPSEVIPLSVIAVNQINSNLYPVPFVLWKQQIQMTSRRKLILYIAASLDGYIAKPNDDLSFLSTVEKPGEDYGYMKFIGSVDTVILGRRTYDWVMKQVEEFPHSNKETYVITRRPQPDVGKTKFYTGDLKELIARLKDEPGRNIFCDGGAEVVNALLHDALIDEIILSIVPVLVGDGIKLFKDGRPEQKAELISVRNFDTGLVQLHYQMVK